MGLLRQNLWVWPLLAAAMMAIAGLMIRHSVETAAQEEMKAGLQALLNSNVEALKIKIPIYICPASLNTDDMAPAYATTYIAMAVIAATDRGWPLMANWQARFPRWSQ